MQSDPQNALVTAILQEVRPTKSVICSVLAFLEAIEEDMEGTEGVGSGLEVVLEREVKENGIAGQGRRAPKHVAKFGLPTDNIKGDLSGRKTPQAKNIMPRLVGQLRLNGFDAAEPSEKLQLLHAVSERFRSMLGLSLGPIRGTAAGKSAAAVVEEILAQAEERGLMSAIAELLVGSKLEICVGERHRASIADQHKWENVRDDPQSLGDYRIENVAIEVTMVEGPDESHRTKANRITSNGTQECWLIVRSGKIKAWQDYIARVPSRYPGMIRCFGICEFVGQNLTETRWRSIGPGADPLGDVVTRLNELVEQLGPQFLPAARIELIG